MAWAAFAMPADAVSTAPYTGTTSPPLLRAAGSPPQDDDAAGAEGEQGATTGTMEDEEGGGGDDIGGVGGGVVGVIVGGVVGVIGVGVSCRTGDATSGEGGRISCGGGGTCEGFSTVLGEELDGRRERGLAARRCTFSRLSLPRWSSRCQLVLLGPRRRLEPGSFLVHGDCSSNVGESASQPHWCHERGDLARPTAEAVDCDSSVRFGSIGVVFGWRAKGQKPVFSSVALFRLTTPLDKKLRASVTTEDRR